MIQCPNCGNDELEVALEAAHVYLVRDSEYGGQTWERIDLENEELARVKDVYCRGCAFSWSPTHGPCPRPLPPAPIVHFQINDQGNLEIEEWTREEEA